MKRSIFLILVIIGSINGDCVIDFDSAETDCAKPLDLNPTIAFFFLTRGYAYVDVPRVEDFVTCTWRKWGYESLNGTINYDRLRVDKMLPWKLARHCYEFGDEFILLQVAFRKAVTDCEKKLPHNIIAEKVRLCVNANYTKYVPYM